MDGLHERETELAMLTDFCASSQRYLWIRADPWAGKSALLSTFLLNPPPNAAVIGFFITARAGENNHRVFTDAVLDQLRVLLPDQQETITRESISRDGLRAELLTTAAEREAAVRRRLVLVVDGLDEYTDTDRTLITDLLPARPHGNLRVIVASRYGPDIHIPSYHPLATATRYELGKSRFAADIEQRARAELTTLLHGDRAHRDLVALITAAKGLTSSDISELTDLAPFEIEPLLRDRAGRSFRTNLVPANLDSAEELAYVLAHETLQIVAEAQLGNQLNTALERLHAWADRYREQGWPAHTPDFLLRRYFPVLDQRKDLARTTALALDSIRHDRIRARTGGDVIALDEIRTIQQHIYNQPDPDLLSTARLARYRDQLSQATTNIPEALPSVWAELGQFDRAETLARSITNSERRDRALSGVAAAIVKTDPDRAETLAATITSPGSRDWALSGVATAIAATDPDHAETLARTITNAWQQAAALSGVAAAIATTDPDRAETLAATITKLSYQAETLSEVAAAIATTDPVRAGRIADRAETLARTITDPEQQDQALSGVAAAIAATDPDRAETLARTITDPEQQAETLSVIVAAITASDPDRADHVADCAVALAYSITSRWQQAEVFDLIVSLIAESDPDRAAHIVDGAEAVMHPDVWRQARQLDGFTSFSKIDPDHPETLAHISTDPWERAQRLSKVAAALAKTAPDRAGRIAEHAETLARTITNPGQQARTLSGVATAIAATDPDRAETLARTITNPGQQDLALSGVATAIAATDPDRAETLARTITNLGQQERALGGVATAIAATDPDRAETLARTITNAWQQADALSGVATVITKTDPGRAGRVAARAETLARTITDSVQQDQALSGVAAAIAATDPDRAETLARTITNAWQQADALSAVAAAIAATDPDRAETFARRTITDLGQQERALGGVAIVVAKTDPDRAETLARTITDAWRRARTLSGVAVAITTTDRHRTQLSDPAGPTSTRPTESSLCDRRRRFLALAWSVAGWEIPVQALCVVDPTVLRALVDDLLIEF
ncbi:ATP-binding protein [Nocardia salmonicida]|uniref:ATP-binding protein n=1 Tax=Nocardia salmonicida TaxID=53431 RepID=UPI00340C5A75